MTESLGGRLLKVKRGKRGTLTNEIGLVEERNVCQRKRVREREREREQ